jgi:hypothetical protein
MIARPPRTGASVTISAVSITVPVVCPAASLPVADNQPCRERGLSLQMLSPGSLGWPDRGPIIDPLSRPPLTKTAHGSDSFLPSSVGLNLDAWTTSL